MTLTLPDSDSPEYADGRRLAPSALRNLDVLLAILSEYAPQHGSALEIASGTGQQIVAFAKAHPRIDWQPSDVNAGNLGSMKAWRDAAHLANLRAPVLLDAGREGWGRGLQHDLVVAVNLLHLIPHLATCAVLAGVADALAPGGRLLIYGPFLRGGRATSDGDATFDASLRAQDPDIGYKDLDWVLRRLEDAGIVTSVQEVAANNLVILGQKRPVPA